MFDYYIQNFSRREKLLHFAMTAGLAWALIPLIDMKFTVVFLKNLFMLIGKDLSNYVMSCQLSRSKIS